MAYTLEQLEIRHRVSWSETEIILAKYISIKGELKEILLIQPDMNITILILPPCLPGSPSVYSKSYAQTKLLGWSLSVS